LHPSSNEGLGGQGAVSADAAQTRDLPVAALSGTCALRPHLRAASADRKRLCSNARSILSVNGEAVNPARAAGVVERLLAAPLAHMRCIPRGVLAACTVHVTKHSAGAVRRYVWVCLRQGHSVRSPVVAGVIDAVGERP